MKAAERWNCQDNSLLSEVPTGNHGVLCSGETVTITLPSVGPAMGQIENHWVPCMDVPDKPGASGERP